MNCKECGAKIPDGWANCKLCGATAPVEEPESRRFCTRCGKAAVAGQAFCGGCGAPLSSRPAAPETPRAEPKKFNPLPLLIALVASLGIILGIASSGSGDFTAYGRSYKSAVKKYCRAYYSGEWGDILDLYHDDVLDQMLEAEDTVKSVESSRADEDGQDYLGDIRAYYGYDWSYDYEIVDEDTLVGDDLEDVQEYYMDEYGVKVSAAKEVELEVTIDGSYRSEEHTRTLHLVKIGWSWYIY